MYRHHKIIIIAALGNHRELGYQNNLPWHLPADLRFFKKITTGHSLIMGRKTHDSIINRLQKPLPDRHHYVVTQQTRHSDHPNITYIPTPLSLLNDMTETVYVIGGASLYQYWLPYAHGMYLTHIHQTFKADVFFPHINELDWNINIHDQDLEGDLPWTIKYYHAKTPLSLSE